MFLRGILFETDLQLTKPVTWDTMNEGMLNDLVEDLWVILLLKVVARFISDGH